MCVQHEEVLNWISDEMSRGNDLLFGRLFQWWLVGGQEAKEAKNESCSQGQARMRFASPNDVGAVHP